MLHNTKTGFAHSTPRPWFIDCDGEGGLIITSPHNKHGLDDDVCEVYGGNDDDKKVKAANAALIVHAVKLLDVLEETREALVYLVEMFDKPIGPTRNLSAAIRTAKKVLTHAR